MNRQEFLEGLDERIAAHVRAKSSFDKEQTKVNIMCYGLHALESQDNLVVVLNGRITEMHKQATDVILHSKKLEEENEILKTRLGISERELFKYQADMDAEKAKNLLMKHQQSDEDM